MWRSGCSMREKRSRSRRRKQNRKRQSRTLTRHSYLRFHLIEYDAQLCLCLLWTAITLDQTKRLVQSSWAAEVDQTRWNIGMKCLPGRGFRLNDGTCSKTLTDIPAVQWMTLLVFSSVGTRSLVVSWIVSKQLAFILVLLKCVSFFYIWCDFCHILMVGDWLWLLLFIFVPHYYCSGSVILWILWNDHFNSLL